MSVTCLGVLLGGGLGLSLSLSLEGSRRRGGGIDYIVRLLIVRPSVLLGGSSGLLRNDSGRHGGTIDGMLRLGCATVSAALVSAMACSAWFAIPSFPWPSSHTELSLLSLCRPFTLASSYKLPAPR